MHEPLPLEHVHIQIAEDDESTSELFVFLFEMYGAQTTIAPSIRESIAQAVASEPDMIVSNLTLLDGSSKELVAQLRRSPNPKLQQMPVIAVTGATRLDETSMEEEMKTAGFQAFLAKPIDPEQLVQLVVALLPGRNPST